MLHDLIYHDGVFNSGNVLLFEFEEWTKTTEKSFYFTQKLDIIEMPCIQMDDNMENV